MSPRHQFDEIPTLNLTSMIDVLFLLIIFFMVGTKFVESDRQIELKLPQVKAGGALSAAPEKKVINVYQDGQITLDRKNVTLDELSVRPMDLLIEDGHVTAPIKGATLIGNGPDVLTRVSMVGNDLKLDEGVGTCGKDGQAVPVGVGIPTLKIDRLTVGGTARKDPGGFMQ